MVSATNIDYARAVTIENEVTGRGLKLKRQGAELVGPCPVCGGRDRFSVSITKQVFNCRGCERGGDVIALVQHLDDCDFVAAVGKLLGGYTTTAMPPSTPSRKFDEDEKRNFGRAEAIWSQASPLGADATTYLARRQIDINQVPAHGGLRFHPHCPWGVGIIPAIIGRFTTALGNEPRGIWRRPITGETPMTLGPIAGCVIRLWPDHAVEVGLVLGEGVETVLAAATQIKHRGTLLQPAWAAGNSGNVKKFPVLPGIETLTLLVDNDLSDRRGRRAGQEAAADCAMRWSTAGREVIRLTPKTLGADFNDVVLCHGA